MASAPPVASYLPRPPTDAELADAPRLEVTGDHRLLLDGVELARTESYEASSVARIEPLVTALKERRARFRAAHPSLEFPGATTLQVEASAPAVLVKSVFQSAAFAGYPNVFFVASPAPGSP